MCFDFLVVRQVVPWNPASSVRGPKYVVKRGKTPVLTAEQARQLLDSIDLSTVAGLRDRAILGVMVYSFARVGAVVGMNVDDYYQNGRRPRLQLHEKGGKFHEVPAHHNAEAYLDAYIEAAGVAGEKKTPLFTGPWTESASSRRSGSPATTSCGRSSAGLGRRGCPTRPAATPSVRPGSPPTSRTAGPSRTPRRSPPMSPRGRPSSTTVPRTKSRSTRSSGSRFDLSSLN